MNACFCFLLVPWSPCRAGSGGSSSLRVAASALGYFMFHLVLGGARSGKSRYAETLAKQQQQPVVYVATAQIRDAEMQNRVDRHQADRPTHWATVEVTIDLPKAIREHRQPGQCVLVDCLTLWMMSLLEANAIEQGVDDLLDAIAQTQGPLVLVSNEITLGVVPLGELSRRYVDELGRLHQRIAAVASHVTLMVAGIPMAVKQPN